MRFAALTLCLAACATGPSSHHPGKLRFANAEPVTKVNDSQPIEKPKHREMGLVAYYLGEDFVEPALRALKIGDRKPAANVNSLGEVRDSSWYTNRAPTPEEIRKGPGQGGPSRDAKWQITGV